MRASSEVLTELAQVIASAAPEELPGLLGELEAAKAVAWARMMRPPPAGQDGSAPPDRNLSAEEAAARLGLSKDWLYRNARSLPFAVRIGRRVLFSERGLERWNRQRRSLTA